MVEKNWRMGMQIGFFPTRQYTQTHLILPPGLQSTLFIFVFLKVRLKNPENPVAQKNGAVQRCCK